MATFTGTNSDDFIRTDYLSDGVTANPAGSFPSVAADVISGLGGNDVLAGVAGADTIYGGDGDGDDNLSHYLYPDESATLSGTASFYGGTGNDRLDYYFPGPNVDFADMTYRMYGEAGDDVLAGSRSRDYLNGGIGDDRYDVSAGAVVIEKPGEGYDTVSSHEFTLPANVEKLELVATYVGGSTFLGGRGTGNGLDNLIVGSAYRDTIYGVAGNDIIYGGAYQADATDDLDLIHGGAGNDTIYGCSQVPDFSGDNADWLYGDAGDDEIFGHNGNDYINGGTGNDKLWGQADNDKIYGGSGNDRLGGGSGNDVVSGQDGDDVLSGTWGLDRLTGGPGNDTFDYDNVAESTPGAATRDIILDYAGVGAAVGDRIDLSSIDANAGVSGNQAFVFGGSGAGHVWAKASGTDSLIQADIGGAAGPELEILVKSAAAGAWTAADFIL